ncbi:hypothetical protein [Streptomyces sp. Isolate_45]|uniref:hypothetical protein n=1 Tax=Streptomyces sp. Isolate_45 TaxID=2950111 RepID=UPI002481E36C|nr:hypothetical protein [Streptomyces sp. Isolate_45]MDA5279952.1 hypothetical protein [Streptomyces sp. Isolate_45]
MLSNVRDKAGRTATLAGSTLLTWGLLAPDVIPGPGLLATTAAAGIGLATNSRVRRAPNGVRGTAIALYAAPHAGVAGLLVCELLAPAGAMSHLVQAGLIALWSGATWWIRPGLLAREVAEEAVTQEVAEVSEPEEEAVVDEPDPVYASPEAQWWAEEIATDGGIAPHTVLLAFRKLTPECLALIIGAAQRGMPVPEMSKAGLSAKFDVPEELIETGPVPGRGANVALVIVGHRPQLAEPEVDVDRDEETWAEIAEVAIPGVTLVEANTYELRRELI